MEIAFFFHYTFLTLIHRKSASNRKSFDRGQPARAEQADQGRYFSQGPFWCDGSHLYEPCSVKKGRNAFAKSIDPYQPAESARADMNQNYFYYRLIFIMLRLSYKTDLLGSPGSKNNCDDLLNSPTPAPAPAPHCHIRPSPNFINVKLSANLYDVEETQ